MDGGGGTITAEDGEEYLGVPFERFRSVDHLGGSNDCTGEARPLNFMNAIVINGLLCGHEEETEFLSHWKCSDVVTGIGHFSLHT